MYCRVDTQMNQVTVWFLIALAVSTLLQLWLALRQIAHVSAHRDTLPASFAGRISPEAHRKAADYTVAKTRFGVVDLFYENALRLLWTLGGGLALLDAFWRGLQLDAMPTGVGVIVSALFLMSLLELPFSAWYTFVLEERFGFNQTTLSTFVGDLIKQGLIALIVGAPLAWVVLWLMAQSGDLWWIYVWAVWMGFSLLMMWLYPALIAPLFNKFTPLDDASLRDRIESLLAKCGFSSRGIFVMDGSKRSGHGNAYFTGFGRNKRIVFYDTLLKALAPAEIEAVLAHELGHFRRRHIQKRVGTLALVSFLALALLGWLIQQPAFYTGLGVNEPSTYMALLLFMLVGPVFAVVLQPLFSRLSRHHEYQADDYAASQTRADELVHALVKLYRDNASTLTPDPLYSAFHDSHPPAPLRVAHLTTKAQTNPAG